MQLSLVAFQKAQRVSAERQRSVVEDTKRDLDYETAAAPEDEYATQFISIFHPLILYAAPGLGHHSGKFSSTNSR